MQLKKYHAQTIKEALQKIKSDLGTDAVIFDTKTLKEHRNIPKRAGKHIIEVTAAIDRESDFGKNKPCMKMRQINFTNNEPKKEICPGHTSAYDGFVHDVCDMEYENKSAVPLFKKTVAPCIKKMIGSGISRDLAYYLVGEACCEFKNSDSTYSFYNILLNKIACYIPVVAPISLNTHERKIITFIGSTGVGKTTTLAKIAAQFRSNSKVKLKIITMDTYRIAAAEQLKIYGKIMSTPVIVVNSEQDLLNELEKKDDFNLILIDTAGRNSNDNEKMNELCTWLQKAAYIESHLLIGAATDEKVLFATVNNFTKARIDRIIIAKADESIQYGHLFNLITATNIPVSYITNGQRVPEDITPATQHALARMILYGYEHIH